MKPGFIMTPDSVRRSQEGIKTLTTRVIQPQPDFLQVYTWKGKEIYYGEDRRWCYRGHISDGWGHELPEFITPLLPYQVKSEYYIREAFIRHASIQQLNGYEADGCTATEHWERRVSARHMPRWAARIVYRVTKIRVRRLHEMTEEDAVLEGLVASPDKRVCQGRRWLDESDHAKGFASVSWFNDEAIEPEGVFDIRENAPLKGDSALDKYRCIWDEINGRRFPWSSNPWTASYRYELMKRVESNGN